VGQVARRSRANRAKRGGGAITAGREGLEDDLVEAFLGIAVEGLERNVNEKPQERQQAQQVKAAGLPENKPPRPRQRAAAEAV